MQLTNRATLFFLTRCLSLSRFPERAGEIRTIIRSGQVNWEQVVWLSTSHMVCQTLYIQLQRADLLNELPADLVEYMAELTSTNRQRNEQIIKQSREMAAILNRESIVPIFIKGSANLLSGLYSDPGERLMVDIDILLHKPDMFRAADILKNHGYTIFGDTPAEGKLRHRHYPPLVKESEPASVEIHHELGKRPVSRYLNFVFVNNSLLKLPVPEEATTFSNQHQIMLNVMAMQMNDGGWYRGNLSIRQSYDLFLLAGRSNPLDAISAFGHYFNRFNAYLATSAELFDDHTHLNFRNTWQTRYFVKKLVYEANHPLPATVYKTIFRMIRLLVHYSSQLIRMLYRPDVRLKLTRKYLKISP